MNPVAAYFLQVVLNWSHVLAPTVPVTIVAVRASHVRKWTFLWLLSGLFLLDMACLLSPRLAFIPQGWNWQGKSLELLWVFAFVATGYAGTFSDVGFRWRLEKGSARPLLFAAGLALLFPLWGVFFAGFRMPTDAETLLFQLTLPGIAEELVFRGVFQSLLNQVFSRPWKLLGAHVGWGFVLTTLLFAAGHGIFVNSSLHLQTSLFSIFPALYLGAVLGWIRERCESLWPCILLHNSVNALFVLGSLLLS